MSIQVQHLTKKYGEQYAVNDISFEVPSGKVYGFLGPNGAGKSTTMKIISCYIPQTSGEVLVCGKNVIENSLEVRRMIGYLPEHNPLYKDMYVKEYLQFSAQAQGIAQPAARIKEMIELTGLGVEQHKQIHQLSKGYRQRVGLAQALLHDPKVLILDEPTTGLDPNQIVEIRNLIISIGKEKTVLLSTHIMQEVQAMCDHVIIIDKGNIVANDTTENLKKGKGKEVVIAVEFKETPSVELLQQIKGVKKVVSVSAHKFNIYSSEVSLDLRAELFQFAVAHSLTIIEMHREERNLEAVFKEVTFGKKGS